MSKRKRAGKASTTSKGERRSSIGVRDVSPAQRLLNQHKAWMLGKRVMVVIDKAGHKVEARSHWGLPPHERKKEVSNADS